MSQGNVIKFESCFSGDISRGTPRQVKQCVKYFSSVSWTFEEAKRAISPQKDSVPIVIEKTKEEEDVILFEKFGLGEK